MAKSKKKSSVMRSAQQDYLYCSSHPSSSYPQRPLSRSISPDLQRPTDSPTHPCLARSFVAFADVVNLYQQPRVRAKLQNRGSYPTTSADQSGSSRSNLHHSGILGDPRSSIPQPGGGASDPEAMLGVEATSPSHMSGKASTAGLGAPSSNAPIGPSPPLVHFSNFTASSTCTFLDTDVGTYKDRWRFSLIGFIAGKFPSYTSISTFVTNSWKCPVNFSMHDSGWLIFTFNSELDMLTILNGGPYHVFGRLMILKIMPEFFDFDTSDMVKMPIWIRFPNLPLQCWSPLCLSKLASVIGKPLCLDTPTSSMTRLSYARVLVETDLLAELSNLISISLPNGVTMSQKVQYESLPRFCKKCRSLGHNTLACISNQHNKRKQQAQTTPTPSGCSPSVDTEAVAKQNPQDMPHGMLGFDPMSAEAAVLGDARIDTSTRKRVKLTTSIPPATPLVVPVPEDADDEPPPMRQYLTRSKAAATSGCAGKQKHHQPSSSSLVETTGSTAYASSPSL
uniref:DUF4283 domain-containing protein n=1 Tax=Populus alba TaxID=43335 RepID=A0A4U5Q9Y8_POPAL|nr:hypothetical protein D5086_0000120500 [Populus alba]